MTSDHYSRLLGTSTNMESSVTDEFADLVSRLIGLRLFSIRRTVGSCFIADFTAARRPLVDHIVGERVATLFVQEARWRLLSRTELLADNCSGLSDIDRSFQLIGKGAKIEQSEHDGTTGAFGMATAHYMIAILPPRDEDGPESWSLSMKDAGRWSVRTDGAISVDLASPPCFS